MMILRIKVHKQEEESENKKARNYNISKLQKQQEEIFDTRIPISRINKQNAYRSELDQFCLDNYNHISQGIARAVSIILNLTYRLPEVLRTIITVFMFS